MTDVLNIDTLNDAQKESLKELKKRFANFPEAYLHDEHYLMHWLVARKFDVNHAEEMLLHHYQYRKALNMDSEWYKTYPINPIMATRYPHGVFSHDKEGHPVAYFSIGGVDNKGIVKSIKSSDISKAILYWQQQRHWNCEDASKLFGKRIQQCVYIMDLKGLSAKHLWKPGLDAFQYVLQLAEKHTPEIIYQLFIINAPAVFPVIYKIIQPIIDENTKRKIHILGENYKDALLNIIDIDNLPVHYGGNALDEMGDPDCKKHIFYGEIVPLDMYYKPDNQNEPNEKELTNLHIKHGKEILIPINIEKPGLILNWFLKSDSALDFGFGVYRKLKDDQVNVKDMEMVEPYFRTFAHFVPESGECITKAAGTYIFQFDNTYSWFYGKNIHYSIKVIEPS